MIENRRNWQRFHDALNLLANMRNDLDKVYRLMDEITLDEKHTRRKGDKNGRPVKTKNSD